MLGVSEMTFSIFWRAAIAAITLMLAAASPASAQTYPQRSIRMIVSIAAGSLTDVIMRAAANELSPRLGQPVVIENRGGAAGIPGAQACAQSSGDGYTLCIVFHNQLSFNPVMFNNLPYDADNDFALVTRLFFLIESIAVHPSLNVKSVAELKALAQAKKQALNWGTLGAGSAPELFLKWINKEWGTEIVGIPYRGGGPMAQALAANEIQVAGVGLGNFLGLAEGGKVKVIAVSAPRRSPLVPDVMTFTEAGLGGYPQRGWWGLATPKGAPKPVIDRLNAEFVRLFSDPKFVAFLEKQAVVPAPTSPEDFAAFVKQDRVHAASLLKLANVPLRDYKPPQ
jgi:tripartite-type tricarboxylate transporter receptor subunit TctC